MSNSISYDFVQESELEAAIALEEAGYPPEEAASLQTFQYRQLRAPDLFLGAYTSIPSQSKADRKLIGYVCSTLSPDTTLTHDSMSAHVPGTSSICIHSVCVSSEYRRKGVALGLLKEYVSRLEKAKQNGAPYERILLISHNDLIGLYEKAGFESLGLSAVVHGPRPWYDMRKILGTPELRGVEIASLTEKLPPGLWEALERSTGGSRPKSRLLSSFPKGIEDVTAGADSSTQITNKYDLLCPREGCGSVILKKNATTFVEGDAVQFDPSAELGQNPHFSSLPTPPAKVRWWKITPDAMAFENIGFSRAVGGLLSPAGKKMKLLSCADCDLGPLGWCEEVGTEFWLVADRVGYRE